MVWAFFIIGGVWFWMLSIVAFVMLVAFVEKENAFYSFLSVAIYIALLSLFSNVNPFTWVSAHPVDFFRIAALYMIIGVVWGVIKFYFHTTKLQRKIERIKETFTKRYVVPPGCSPEEVTAHRQQQWTECLHKELGYEDTRNIKLSNQANNVIFWMSYWPASALWTLLNDPLRRIGKTLYHYVFIKIFKTIHSRTIGKSLEL